MPQLFFKRTFQQAIREGRKLTTIRRWDRPLLAAGEQANSPGLGWLAIESVEVVELDNLDDDHARADGFETKVLLVQALRAFYPDFDTDQKQWFLIRFRLHQPQVKRSRLTSRGE
jgi:hypothetical protein